MSPATLLTPVTTVNTLEWYAQQPIWGGRGGGRHWRVYRVLYRLAHRASTTQVRISLADLALHTNISSHSGLDRSLKFLVKHGMLDVIDGGAPDAHIGGEHSKGRAATYAIRQLGATGSQGVPLDISRPTHTSSSSHGNHVRAQGCSPLPNGNGSGRDWRDQSDRHLLPDYDMKMDLWVEEPHLLRLIDLMWAVDGSETITGLTPTSLAERLGISVSGAWEMLKRWSERMIVNRGMIAVWRVTEMAGESRHESLVMRLRKAAAIRKAALDGRWVPRRIRVWQRMQTRQCGAFRVLDFDAAEVVRRMQEAKGEMGLVPWLEGYEFAGVV